MFPVGTCVIPVVLCSMQIIIYIFFQVMVLPADQCVQYNTCAACVSEARASGCGWCVSTRMCSSQGHCNDAISSQIPWIHHGDSFQCLASVQSTFYTLVQRLAAHDLHHPVSFFLNSSRHQGKENILISFHSSQECTLLFVKVLRLYKALS